jgi:hypothetical protein
LTSASIKTSSPLTGSPFRNLVKLAAFVDLVVKVQLAKDTRPGIVAVYDGSECRQLGIAECSVNHDSVRGG